jgi:hypothetical protein
MPLGRRNHALLRGEFRSPFPREKEDPVKTYIAAAVVTLALLAVGFGLGRATLTPTASAGATDQQLVALRQINDNLAAIKAGIGTKGGGGGHSLHQLLGQVCEDVYYAAHNSHPGFECH